VKARQAPSGAIVENETKAHPHVANRSSLQICRCFSVFLIYPSIHCFEIVLLSSNAEKINCIIPLDIQDIMSINVMDELVNRIIVSVVAVDIQGWIPMCSTTE
jgi:hypothetical protein